MGYLAGPAATPGAHILITFLGYSEMAEERVSAQIGCQIAALEAG